MKISRKGFTLAELLIVVAIIAVLVAVAIPVFGSQLEKSREAADALSQYICNAKPSDYHYEGYCMDGPCMVYEGVKDGAPYRMEKELDLYDEEFAALYERLYGTKKEM